MRLIDGDSLKKRVKTLIDDAQEDIEDAAAFDDRSTISYLNIRKGVLEMVKEMIEDEPTVKQKRQKRRQ